MFDAIVGRHVRQIREKYKKGYQVNTLRNTKRKGQIASG